MSSFSFQKTNASLLPLNDACFISFRLFVLYLVFPKGTACISVPISCSFYLFFRLFYSTVFCMPLLVMSLILFSFVAEMGSKISIGSWFSWHGTFALARGDSYCDHHHPTSVAPPHVRVTWVDVLPGGKPRVIAWGSSLYLSRSSLLCACFLIAVWRLKKQLVEKIKKKNKPTLINQATKRYSRLIDHWGKS